MDACRMNWLGVDSCWNGTKLKKKMDRYSFTVPFAWCRFFFLDWCPALQGNIDLLVILKSVIAMGNWIVFKDETRHCRNLSKAPYDAPYATGKRFAKDVIWCPTGKWEALCQGRHLMCNRQVGSALPRTSSDVQQASGKRFAVDVTWRPGGREWVNSNRRHQVNDPLRLDVSVYLVPIFLGISCKHNKRVVVNSFSSVEFSFNWYFKINVGMLFFASYCFVLCMTKTNTWHCRTQKQDCFGKCGWRRRLSLLFLLLLLTGIYLWTGNIIDCFVLLDTFGIYY